MNTSVRRFLYNVLAESKHIGTHAGSHRFRDELAHQNTQLFPQAARRSHTLSRNALDTKIERFYNLLLSRIRQLRSGSVKSDLVIRDIKEELKSLYHQAYAHGLRGSAAGTHPDILSSEDIRWVDSAYTHELRYLNRFLAAVYTLSPAQVERRARMYCDTVRSVYDSGRVQGASPNSLIYWVWSPEAQHCVSCVYLRDHSPYTKNTLPTTPRAGGTECLVYCKCHLRIVPAAPEIVQQVEQRSLKRSTMLTYLASLKRNKSKSWRRRQENEDKCINTSLRETHTCHSCTGLGEVCATCEESLESCMCNAPVAEDCSACRGKGLLNA